MNDRIIIYFQDSFLNQVVHFLILLLVFLSPLTTCLSQQGSEITFHATSDTKEVLLNSYFEVSFTLKNANGVNFVPPSFKDFKVIDGPNKSTSMEIVQGRVEREMGFSYTLQPEGLGQFEIGVASIEANGRKLTTKPLTIRVLKENVDSSAKSKLEEGAFVLIEPNKKEVFLGEQILIDYKLYTSVNLDAYDIIEEPDYKGFYAQELRRFNSRTQSEVIQGKHFTTKVLRRLALFPNRSGKLVIPSAKIQLAVIEDNDKSGIFFSRKIRPVTNQTIPVEIMVKDLPDNPPVDFTGAVGQYEFQVVYGENAITTDNAFSLSFLISGDGDIKRVQVPELLLSDSLEIYPPKIIEEKIIENQGQLTGRKIIEYLVLPKYAGNFNFQPTFSYFDTDSKEYRTILAQPITFHVKKGANIHNKPSISTAGHKEKSKDIRTIKYHFSLAPTAKYFIESPIFYVIILSPFLLFIGLLILRIMKKKSFDQNEKNTKINNTKKIALNRLQLANVYLRKSSSPEFYNEILKTLNGYFSHKTGIPLSEISKESISEKLNLLNINPEITNNLITIINTCEMALYANKNSSSEMLEIYKKTIVIIEMAEEEILKTK